MKKIVVVFLIISILNLVSCYYYSADKEEFLNQKEKLDISIVTQDSEVYFFDAGKYFVENDTIKGLCKQEIRDKKGVKYKKYDYEKVQVPLSEIKEYKIENPNHLAISLIFVGAFSVGLFLVILNGLTDK